MKKVLSNICGTALIALILLVGVGAHAQSSAVTEDTPATVPSAGCYNFTNNLYYGVHRWEGYPAVVNKLRAILTTNEGARITDRTGTFGFTTAQAVSNFQEKYASEILTPQGLTNGTGIVDPLTIKALNQRYGCIDKAAVTLVSPNTKMAYAVGDKVLIKWNAARIPNTTDLKISYLSTRPSSVAQTITTQTRVKNGAGSYEWVIPSTMPSGEYVLTVELAGSVKSDMSATAFTIQEKAAELITPNNGGEYTVGDPIQVTWNRSTVVPDAYHAVVRLVKVGGGTSVVIGDTKLSTGQISTTVPLNLEGEFDVRLEVYPNKGVAGDITKTVTQDTADKTIKINANTLTLSAPVARDLAEVKPGSTINVAWSFKGKPSNVAISLVGPGGVTMLIPNTAGGSRATKSASVKIPVNQVLGSNYMIKVEEVSGTVKRQATSPVFSITSASQVTVLKPVASDVFNLGDTITINWSSTNLNNLKVALYRGTQIIRDSICAINNTTVTSCTYKIPTDNTQITEGSNYRVRITSTTNSSITDESDDFTIKIPTGISLADISGKVSRGDKATIEWNTTGSVPADMLVNIDASIAGKTVRLASNVRASTKKWVWNIPATQQIGEYTIKISSTKNALIADDMRVAIDGQSLTVTSPVAETNPKLGDTLTVRWTSVGVIDAVKVDLVNTTTNVVTSIPNRGNTGATSWKIPTTQSPGTYKVVVTYTADTAIKAESPTFTIGSVMSISINPLETSYSRGGTLRVGWIANNIATIKIELLKDGTFDRFIERSLLASTNGGSFSYRIPANLTPSEKYSVRVTSLNPNNSAINAVSNTFSIK